MIKPSPRHAFAACGPNTLSNRHERSTEPPALTCHRAVDMVVNLEDLTQHLFLSVLSQGTSTDTQSRPDTILGVTFLAMLFNAAYVVGRMGGVGAARPCMLAVALAEAKVLVQGRLWCTPRTLQQ